MAKAHVSLENNLQAAIDIRDFTLMSDEALESGGTDLGPEPPELFLGSLGACAAITIKLYAMRKGWDVRKIDVELELERVDPADYPEVSKGAPFLHIIHKRYTLEGDLDDEQKARLMEIGGKCPVARVVQHPVIFKDTLN